MVRSECILKASSRSMIQETGARLYKQRRREMRGRFSLHSTANRSRALPCPSQIVTPGNRPNPSRGIGHAQEANRRGERRQGQGGAGSPGNASPAQRDGGGSPGLWVYSGRSCVSHTNRAADETTSDSARPKNEHDTGAQRMKSPARSCTQHMKVDNPTRANARIFHPYSLFLAAIKTPASCPPTLDLTSF